MDSKSALIQWCQQNKWPQPLFSTQIVDNLFTAEVSIIDQNSLKRKFLCDRPQPKKKAAEQSAAEAAMTVISSESAASTNPQDILFPRLLKILNEVRCGKVCDWVPQVEGGHIHSSWVRRRDGQASFGVTPFMLYSGVSSALSRAHGPDTRCPAVAWRAIAGALIKGLSSSAETTPYTLTTTTQARHIPPHSASASAHIVDGWSSGVMIEFTTDDTVTENAFRPADRVRVTLLTASDSFKQCTVSPFQVKDISIHVPADEDVLTGVKRLLIRLTLGLSEQSHFELICTQALFLPGTSSMSHTIAPELRLFSLMEVSEPDPPQESLQMNSSQAIVSSLSSSLSVNTVASWIAGVSIYGPSCVCDVGVRKVADCSSRLSLKALSCSLPSGLWFSQFNGPSTSRELYCDTHPPFGHLFSLPRMYSSFVWKAAGWKLPSNILQEFLSRRSAIASFTFEKRAIPVNLADHLSQIDVGVEEPVPRNGCWEAGIIDESKSPSTVKPHHETGQKQQTEPSEVVHLVTLHMPVMLGPLQVLSSRRIDVLSNPLGLSLSPELFSHLGQVPFVVQTDSVAAAEQQAALQALWAIEKIGREAIAPSLQFPVGFKPLSDPLLVGAEDVEISSEEVTVGVVPEDGHPAGPQIIEEFRLVIQYDVDKATLNDLFGERYILESFFLDNLIICPFDSSHQGSEVMGGPASSADSSVGYRTEATVWTGVGMMKHRLESYLSQHGAAGFSFSALVSPVPLRESLLSHVNLNVSVIHRRVVCGAAGASSSSSAATLKKYSRSKIFSPSLAVQRRRLLTALLRGTGAKTWLDAGCGNGAFLSCAFERDVSNEPILPLLTHVAGLDINFTRLLEAKKAFSCVYESARCDQTGVAALPSFSLWGGSLINPQHYRELAAVTGLRSWDCVSCVEVIEHLSSSTVAEDVAVSILVHLAPRFTLFSTPNFEANECIHRAVYPIQTSVAAGSHTHPPRCMEAMIDGDSDEERNEADDTELAASDVLGLSSTSRTQPPSHSGTTVTLFREEDHKFEFTREEFREWCHRVCQRAVGQFDCLCSIACDFCEIGSKLPGMETTGGATQAVVMKRELCESCSTSKDGLSSGEVGAYERDEKGDAAVGSDGIEIEERLKCAWKFDRHQML